MVFSYYAATCRCVIPPVPAVHSNSCSIATPRCPLVSGLWSRQITAHCNWFFQLASHTMMLPQDEPWKKGEGCGIFYLWARYATVGDPMTSSDLEQSFPLDHIKWCIGSHGICKVSWTLWLLIQSTSEVWSWFPMDHIEFKMVHNVWNSTLFEIKMMEMVAIDDNSQG